jgi:prepilin-type N-terminal cleavage/methylation domain-containing protein
MNREKRAQAAGRLRAFSLIEILLAVALLGALLLALNVFIFSMGEIWGRGREQRLFNEHARAVTRHVEKMLRSAALAPAALAGQSAILTVEEIRGDNGTEPWLTFDLPEGDRVLPWPEHPLPDVRVSLAAVGNQGLVLYWHSRHEIDFAEQAPRSTVLSPLVTTLTYDYYQEDFKTWQNQPRLQRDRQGLLQAPSRLRLRFALDKMTTETLIVLPVPTSALPAF